MLGLFKIHKCRNIKSRFFYIIIDYSGFEWNGCFFLLINILDNMKVIGLYIAYSLLIENQQIAAWVSANKSARAGTTYTRKESVIS